MAYGVEGYSGTHMFLLFRLVSCLPLPWRAQELYSYLIESTGVNRGTEGGADKNKTEQAQQRAKSKQEE